MSQPKIRQALETRLAALTPSISTVEENKPFTPVVGQPYQEVFLLPAKPDNTALGTAYRREIGIFQVTLKYPQGHGAGAAEARAELVKGWFKIGQVFTASPMNVLITLTPHVRPGRKDGDRWRIDIDIPYQAEVFG